MINALSRLPNQTKHVGVPYQTCDAHLFTLQLEWLHNVYEYLLEGVMIKIFTTSQRQYLTQRAKPFVLQEGYYINLDKITCLSSFATRTCAQNFARIAWRSCKRAFIF
jgi:hypothetical protein